MNKLSGAGTPEVGVYKFGVFAPYTSFPQVLVLGLVAQKLKDVRSRTRKVSRAPTRCSQVVHAEQQLYFYIAVPRAEHGHHKAKEHATEEDCGSGSEDDHSDSDDEGTDGYKKGDTICSVLMRLSESSRHVLQHGKALLSL